MPLLWRLASRDRVDLMVLAILQARLSSTRLPGKVLMPLFGKPMLERQIERIRRAQTLSRIVVATSTESSDDPLAALCQEIGIACFRGSLNDVLDRFYHAASGPGVEHVVRLTGDCPLADWSVIDRAVSTCLSGAYDYVSNGMEPTFPDGLDVEVMRFSVLEEAWREARLPSEREHVTPFIYNNPQRYRLFNIVNDVDLSALRWTVDEAQDLRFVEAVYAALYPANPAFTMRDVLTLLHTRRDISDAAGLYNRNEGYMKSLAADRRWVEERKS